MTSTDTASRRTLFREALNFRHATKTFDTTRTISDEDFNFLLDAARLSPTSFGFEPWRLVVVQDRALRERLKSVSWGAQGQLPTASHFVAVTVLRGSELVPQGHYLEHLLKDVKEWSEEGRGRTKTKYASFLSEDFKLDSPEKITEWAARQAYIVLSNLMTAAAFVGIDSCPIEGFHLDSAEAVLDGHGGFDRNKHALVCLAAFGYRTSDPQPKVRRDLSESVGWA